MSLISKRKVLVCGVTGFIGRNMAEALAQRDEFDVTGVYYQTPPFENSKIRMVQGDLTNPADIKRLFEGVDVVIQAAATTSGAKDIVTKPFLHVTDNAVMNSLIFRAAYEQKVSQLVFFSCSVMYPADLGRPVKEDDFDGVIYPGYFGIGWTKVYLEKMAEFYSKLGHTKYTVIRHSNIYGPHDKFDLEKSHVFGATVTKVLKSPNGKITVWGDGEEERDLLYIDDLVDYVQRAINAQEIAYDLSNVGYGSSISVSDLIGKIIATSGKEVAIEYDRSKPTLKTKVCLDISKARETLGWEPKTSLDEGIGRTLEWYYKNSG